MSQEENKAVVRKYYELIDKGDMKDLMRLFSDDITWRFPWSPEGLNKESLGGQIQAFRIAFPDMQHIIRNELAEGDRVATVVAFRGTQMEELQGVPSSGKQVECSGLNIHRIRDGKIAEAETGFDVITLMQQMGTIPAP